MNRSAKGGTRSSPHYWGEGALIHPPHQGVCGRHGTELVASLTGPQQIPFPGADLHYLRQSGGQARKTDGRVDNESDQLEPTCGGAAIY
jgi:hypothetical protein